MTTNGDDDPSPTANGDLPSSDGFTGDRKPATSCRRCTELQEELDRSHRDRALYTSIKKKITLTDTLIRKYNSKCQDYDQQQRKLEDVAYKLASAKRDCKIFEQQLTTTLEELIPWRLHKDKFRKELEECKTELRETRDKLAGSEASCVQFKDGFYEMQEKLETLEDSQADLKKAADKSQQAEKKASAFLSKNKDDLSTCKKELQTAKKREASLATKHQQAKNKISELVEILRDRGIPVPRVPKSLLEGPASVRESASTEDTDFEQVGELFSPPMERRESSAAEGRPEPKEETRRASTKEAACLKILDRFSCDLSACVSPLPPSPIPSDASSNISRNDGTDDEVFADVADQIESQLHLAGEEGVRDAGEESREVPPPEWNRRLRQTPPRRAVCRRRLRDAGAREPDDSEEETSRLKKPARRRPRGSKNGSVAISARGGGPADVAEVLSEPESEASGPRCASSRETGSSADESDQLGGPEKGNTGTEEVSSKSCTGITTHRDKYQERCFNEMGREDLFRFSSTLSDDSDDGRADAKREPSGNPAGGSSPVADLGSPSTVEGRRELPPYPDLAQSRDDTRAEHEKPALSPDRRLTRSQLKTLTEQGAMKKPAVADLLPCQTLPKQSPAKSSIDHSEPDMKAPLRLVTRSLSVSENESQANGASLSPSRPVFGQDLRPDSAPEERPISGDASGVRPPMSPVLSSPRRMHRSSSLLGQTSSIADEKPAIKLEDPVGNRDNLTKSLKRSISAPEDKSSEMVVDGLVKVEENSTRDDTRSRRFTRSQAHLQNQIKIEIIPKRVTRSVSKQSNTKLALSPMPNKKPNIDWPSSKDEDKDFTKRREPSSDGQESNIADAASALVDSESRNPELVLDCGVAKSESKTLPPESTSVPLHWDVGRGSQSSSEVKPYIVESPEQSEDHGLFSVGTTGHALPEAPSDVKVRQDSEIEPPERETDSKKTGDSSESGSRSAHDESGKLPLDSENRSGHLQRDESEVAEGSRSEQGQKLEVSNKPFEFDRIGSEASESESEAEQPEREGRVTPDVNPTGGSGARLEEHINQDDDPRGLLQLGEGGCDTRSLVHSATNKTDPRVGFPPGNEDEDPGNVQGVDPAGRDFDEGKTGATAETSSCESDSGSSSADAAELRSVADCPVEGVRLQPKDDGDPRHGSELGTASSPSGGLRWEDAGRGAWAGRTRAEQRQVLCMEAESSRASTPTADESVAINSVSGRVPPLSPLPLRDASRPLSPLSSPPRSPPLSPLAPSPICLEGFAGFPRMLSPLPPSPGMPDRESADSAARAALAEVSGLLDQPRMISPLFPTPVPPAVSPLPDVPSANLLSPLFHPSPAGPGHSERSPLVSPLRNPLIPPPCNFHAVAPSDALSVRAQHCPVARRQPASRCLAASFTSTTAGMSPNPEIISPRLRSLASEMIFEFGESLPGTSGVQRPLPWQAPAASLKETSVESQDIPETPNHPKLQGQRSRISGFMESRSKASASKNAPTFELPNIQPVLENDSKTNQDSCLMVQEQTSDVDKMPPCGQIESDQPKMRPTSKLSSSRKKDLGKSLPQLGHKETADEEATDRRCTRSRAALAGGLPSSASESTGGKRETPSRLCRKTDAQAGTGEESFKTPKRKKRPSSSSDPTETAAKEPDSQEGASAIEPEHATIEERGPAISAQSTAPDPAIVPPKRGRVKLIPELELKTSGFKKSCSKRKRPAKPDGEAASLPEEGEPEFPRDDVSEPGVSAEGSAGRLETKASGENQHVTGQQDQKVFDCSVKLEVADILVQMSDYLTGRPCAAAGQTVQQPASLCGASSATAPRRGQRAATTPGVVVPPREASATLGKARSSIGSIWGDMASRKDEAADPLLVPKRQPRNPKKVKKRKDKGAAQPPAGPGTSSHTCGRVEGFDDALLAQAKKQLQEVDAASTEAERTANSRTDCETISVNSQKSELSDAAPAVASSKGHQTSCLPQMSQTVVPQLSRSTRPRLGAHSQTGTPAPPQRQLGLAPLAAADADPRAANAGRPSTDESWQPAPPPPTLTGRRAVSVTGPESRSGQRTVTTEGVPFGRHAPPSVAGWNPDNRKRRASSKDDLTRDTACQPSPGKQAKISPGPGLSEARTEFKQPMPEVAPPVSKVEPRPVLSELLTRVRALRSRTNAKPLFAAILAFLGQNAISVMLAIRAKCTAKNTSTKPLLLPHEEELVSGIVESGLLSKKSNTSMLLACLGRGIQSPPLSTQGVAPEVVGAAFCRVFATLCRKIGLIDRVRVFCYDLLRAGFPNVEELLLNVAVTWPTVLRKKESASSPVLAAVEIVAMQRLVLAASPQNLQAQEIIHCLVEICGWRIPEGDLPIVRCHQLVTSLQDTNVTKLFSTGSPTRALTPKSYEVVKALGLYASHLGWPWANNQLIRDRLWPVLKAWSHQVRAAGTGSGQRKPVPAGSAHRLQSRADASACAVMKVIGDLAGLGLNSHRESVCELLRMLAAVLQQPSDSVPWTVQVFTAEAVLCLSPGNPRLALDVTKKWKQQAAFATPPRIQDKLRTLETVVGALDRAPS